MFFMTRYQFLKNVITFRGIFERMHSELKNNTAIMSRAVHGLYI